MKTYSIGHCQFAEDVAVLAEAVNIITADSVVSPSKEDLEELQEERVEFSKV